MAQTLLAGIAREDITPAVGTVLMGYAPRVSQSVHDNLTVTALALQQGDTRCAIVSITTTVIDDEEHERIRARVAQGLPVDSMVPPAVARYIAQHRLYRD